MIDPILKATSIVHGSTSSSLLVTSVSFDFTTAAVVSFVLVLLGLAAGLLLMIRFANQRVRKGSN
jgi:hypothetical protein